MSYTIQINEAQRDIIEQALTVAKHHHSQFFSDTEKEEVDLLHAMFTDLPNQEKGSPGALHGFCL